MRAIFFEEFGGPEVLEIKEIDDPKPTAGYATIEVKAFGLNHAEMHMRKGEWPEWNAVSGLECVGVITACPGGEFEVGLTVGAAMGGIGRSIPGSYAEFVNVPVSNVFAIKSSLSWEDLAVLPELYSTAWSCLFTVMELKKGETLLIRGATSTLGQAAVRLAVDVGAVVTATTRRPSAFSQLMAMGVHAVEEEGPKVVANHTSQGPAGELRFDAVLNLVGNSVLVETLGIVRPGGHMCQAGWLGGLAPVVDFNPMVEMASGVHFSLFHSKVLGTAYFPMSAIPLQEIIVKIESGCWEAKPVQVFEFGQIRAAHSLMDTGRANGKLVVRV
jgi:NADPH2:quinone reductase